MRNKKSASLLNFFVLNILTLIAFNYKMVYENILRYCNLIDIKESTNDATTSDMRFRISSFFASDYGRVCLRIWRARIILRPTNPHLPASRGSYLPVLCVNSPLSSSTSLGSAHCSSAHATHVDGATAYVDGASATTTVSSSDFEGRTACPLPWWLMDMAVRFFPIS
jgi:hypothetical protein